MPDKHAILSASGSAKWLNCPPSAREEAELPDQQTSYAEEGTLAHSIAEQKLRNWKEGYPRKKVKCDDKSMDDYTTEYRDYVLEVFNEEKAKGGVPCLEVEVQLDLSRWVPEGFGTSDAVVIGENTLHIIDFKYGKGVPVKAENNSQLKLYAGGALDLYECLYDFDTVTLHIVQPRLGNFDSWSIPVGFLKIWLNRTVKPTAEQAFIGEGMHRCGAWCRFCKVRYACKTRTREMILTAEQGQAKHTNQLLPVEISALLPKLDGIQKWAKELQDYALQQALNGTIYEGYKVVEGTSRRKIADELDACKKLQTAGYKYTDIMQTKLKTITELEKLTGKKELPKILGDTIQKPQGAPTLVPESDKRPPYKTVQQQADLDAWSEAMKGEDNG